jgi:dihydrofolate reductase
MTAGAFLERNLIDLLELAVVPVALGRGRTLFGGVAAPTTFEQAGSEAIGSGCVVNTYRRIVANRATTPRRRRAQSRF